MKKKVFFLLPSLKYGGAEQVAINLALQFKQNNFDVQFLVFTDVGELREKVKKDFEYINLDCKKSFQLPFKLIKFIKNQSPNQDLLLISSFWKLNLCASLTKLFFPRLKLLLWEHSLPSKTTYIPNWLYFLSASIFYRLANAVVCVSTGVFEDVKSLTLKLNNLVTIHNPITPPDLSIKRMNNNNSNFDRAKSIIWVGRMDCPKNPHLALDAFLVLHKRKRGNYSIKFVGDGPLFDEMKERVKSLNLDSVVSFTGFVDDPYIYMINADLLLLTSIREGLPTVVIEALYCDLKVVSTNCSNGLNDIFIKGKFGALSLKNSPEEIAALIEKSLTLSLPSGHQLKGSIPFRPETIFLKYKDLLGL